MKRDYKKRPLFDRKQLGAAAFALFLAFVTYTILTPPRSEIARISSPDGSRTARLRKIYYVSQPAYKIDFREKGKLLWLNLRYFPGGTNAPLSTAEESLVWSSDSDTLHFNINGTSVWSHAFSD